MKHTEFTLTVKKTIYETSGSVKAKLYSKGDQITVDEAIFADLQSGCRWAKYTNSGVVYLHKDLFENEVTCTTIEVSYTTRKLGQRKAK
jgi:hypothetical protein